MPSPGSGLIEHMFEDLRNAVDVAALYIARLLVDPSARRTGRGRALLDYAR